MCLCARVSVCMFACLFTPFFAQWMNKLWTITLHLCFNFVLWIVKKWFYAPHQSIWNVCIMQIHVSTINCVTRALRSVGDWACVFEQCTCSAKKRTNNNTNRTIHNEKPKTKTLFEHTPLCAKQSSAKRSIRKLLSVADSYWVVCCCLFSCSLSL